MNKYVIHFTQERCASVIGESIDDAIQNFKDGHCRHEWDSDIVSIDEVVKTGEVEEING